MFLIYGCETWTQLADSEKRTQAFETKCTRKLLRISFLEYKTNDWVRTKINFRVGPQEPLSGNCQETETSMVWACHTPWQPPQNHPSGHLQGWMTPWSAEETVGGQHQRKEWTCQNCSQGPAAEKTGRGSLLNHSTCPLRWPNRSRDWTELIDMVSTSIDCDLVQFNSSSSMENDSEGFSKIRRLCVHRGEREISCSDSLPYCYRLFFNSCIFRHCLCYFVPCNFWSIKKLLVLVAPALVHSGSASWGSCSQVLPDELHVHSFSLMGSHTMPEQQSAHSDFVGSRV